MNRATHPPSEITDDDGVIARQEREGTGALTVLRAGKQLTCAPARPRRPN